MTVPSTCTEPDHQASLNREANAPVADFFLFGGASAEKGIALALLAGLFFWAWCWRCRYGGRRPGARGFLGLDAAAAFCIGFASRPSVQVFRLRQKARNRQDTAQAIVTDIHVCLQVSSSLP